MIAAYDVPRLVVDSANFDRSFDQRPFGSEHNLSGLDLFSEPSLRALAARYDRDFMVAASAPTPATKFYSVPYGSHTPLEAFDRLDSGNQRILLKMPENHDRRYRDLLHTLFEQVVALRGGLRGERVERLASSILISSAEAITPFHFDPEISFFFQISGEKVYHLYAPSVLSEAELERFYVMGIVNIGQVELAGRDPKSEYVFRLVDGKGMHQPQNCPHWVETRANRSVSYVFSFETETTRSLGRTRAFNHYMRRCRLTPAPLGARPGLDRAKSWAMRVAIPLRKSIGRGIGALRSRR